LLARVRLLVKLVISTTVCSVIPKDIVVLLTVPVVLIDTHDRMNISYHLLTSEGAINSLEYVEFT
jgi:hypothetical protein